MAEAMITVTLIIVGLMLLGFIVGAVCYIYRPRLFQHQGGHQAHGQQAQGQQGQSQVQPLQQAPQAQGTHQSLQAGPDPRNSAGPPSEELEMTDWQELNHSTGHVVSCENDQSPETPLETSQPSTQHHVSIFGPPKETIHQID